MNTNIVNCEVCINCEEHKWYNYHNELKYHSVFNEIQILIEREMPFLKIQKNKTPPHMLPVKNETYKNFYFNMKTNKLEMYPRIGSFEVYFNEKLIFSKLSSNSFPEPNFILNAFSNMISKEKIEQTSENRSKIYSAHFKSSNKGKKNSQKNKSFLISKKNDEKITPSPFQNKFYFPKMNIYQTNLNNHFHENTSKSFNHKRPLSVRLSKNRPKLENSLAFQIFDSKTYKIRKITSPILIYTSENTNIEKNNEIEKNIDLEDSKIFLQNNMIRKKEMINQEIQFSQGKFMEFLNAHTKIRLENKVSEGIQCLESTINKEIQFSFEKFNEYMKQEKNKDKKEMKNQEIQIETHTKNKSLQYSETQFKAYFDSIVEQNKPKTKNCTTQYFNITNNSETQFSNEKFSEFLKSLKKTTKNLEIQTVDKMIKNSGMQYSQKEFQLFLDKTNKKQTKNLEIQTINPISHELVQTYNESKSAGIQTTNIEVKNQSIQNEQTKLDKSLETSLKFSIDQIKDIIKNPPLPKQNKEIITQTSYNFNKESSFKNIQTENNQFYNKSIQNIILTSNKSLETSLIISPEKNTYSKELQTSQLNTKNESIQNVAFNSDKSLCTSFEIAKKNSFKPIQTNDAIENYKTYIGSNKSIQTSIIKNHDICFNENSNKTANKSIETSCIFPIEKIIEKIKEIPKKQISKPIRTSVNIKTQNKDPFVRRKHKTEIRTEKNEKINNKSLEFQNMTNTKESNNSFLSYYVERKSYNPKNIFKKLPVIPPNSGNSRYDKINCNESLDQSIKRKNKFKCFSVEKKKLNNKRIFRSQNIINCKYVIITMDQQDSETISKIKFQEKNFIDQKFNKKIVYFDNIKRCLKTFNSLNELKDNDNINIIDESIMVHIGEIKIIDPMTLQNIINKNLFALIYYMDEKIVIGNFEKIKKNNGNIIRKSETGSIVVKKRKEILSYDDKNLLKNLIYKRKNTNNYEVSQIKSELIKEYEIFFYNL